MIRGVYPNLLTGAITGAHPTWQQAVGQFICVHIPDRILQKISLSPASHVCLPPSCQIEEFNPVSIHIFLLKTIMEIDSLCYK